MELELKKYGPKEGCNYRIYYNHHYMGDTFPKEDGFYDYWPSLTRGGYVGMDFLIQLLDKLKELNAPMEKSLEEYFEQEST